MPRTSRSRVQLSEEEKKKRRREQKKLSIRRARARMSQEEIEKRREKDRERYHRKKEQGLIKTIKDFTSREQRQMRRIWRDKAKIKREKEKLKKNAEALRNNTTPTTSSASRSRVIVGRAVAARNRRRLVAENDFLKNRINVLESRLSKYRMRLVRISKKNILDKELPTNAVAKNKTKEETRRAVHSFLLLDEHSRLTSGRKETVTRKKVKKQIRWLNDSLLNLHKAFVNKTGLQISYETFRRNRPFWVLIPKVNNRNTCLCIIHENNNLIVQALQKAKILIFRSATDAIKSLCCNNSLNLACLERRCSSCEENRIQCEEYEPNDSVSYERWITKNVTIVVKGESKICRKTIKERVTTNKQKLFEIFESNLPKFVQHVANYIHQLQTIQEIKQKMSFEEGLLHMDFSENYNCKYGAEVQAAHFQGSKPQVSLHTSVYYSTESDVPENYIKSTSICTISRNLRHDPVLICAHLHPVMKKIKELSPSLKHLHILSDGPSTQYRNKTMFHLMATYLKEQLDVCTITWHFSEAGHGKGAPDGVGGCIKRICDSAVARGTDVSNFEAVLSCLEENCKGIEIYEVNEDLIPEIQEKADECATRPFKGTFKIHQITWSINQPRNIQVRRLSCLICAAHVNCRHFGLGSVDILFKRSASSSPGMPSEHSLLQTVASSSTSASPQPETLNLPISPRSSPTADTLKIRYAAAAGYYSTSETDSPRPGTPHSPGNPATPDAPTVPNTPSTPRTPEVSILENNQERRRPRKVQRRLIFSDNSDKSSDESEPTAKKHAQRKRIFIKDSDEDIF